MYKHLWLSVWVTPCVPSRALPVFLIFCLPSLSHSSSFLLTREWKWKNLWIRQNVSSTKTDTQRNCCVEGESERRKWKTDWQKNRMLTREEDFEGETGSASNHLSEKESKMVFTSCFLTLFWTIVLLLIGYPTAIFFSMWYVIFQPFQVCCTPCLPIAQFFFRMVQLPLSFAKRAKASCSTTSIDGDQREQRPTDCQTEWRTVVSHLAYLHWKW